MPDTADWALQSLRRLAMAAQWASESLRRLAMAARRSSVSIVAAVLSGIVLVSAFAYWGMQAPPLDEQLIYGSGRIEATEVRVGVEVAGRLIEVNAVEGARLERGELVARIDARDYELQRAHAEARRRAANELTSQLARQIGLADHHAGTARTDLERYEALAQRGFATEQHLDRARDTYREAFDEAGVLRDRHAQARAEAQAASAMVALARSQIAKTEVLAPRSGAVLERLAEPGEVIGPGQPVAILADLSSVRLRIFIPERDLGKVRLGAPARIRIDSFPERYFDARVSQVDAQAQFTPRDVHMQDERSRTVYGVTLMAANQDQVLRPGMPADAWILWDADAEWPPHLRIPE